jgi:hypothetical protein
MATFVTVIVMSHSGPRGLKRGGESYRRFNGCQRASRKNFREPENGRFNLKESRCSQATDGYRIVLAAIQASRPTGAEGR